MNILCFYRVAHLVRCSWVGLTLIGDVPPSCPTSHQPKQNQADGGTDQIKVSSTQLYNQMDHPVVAYNLREGSAYVKEDLKVVGPTKSKLTKLLPI